MSNQPSSDSIEVPPRLAIKARVAEGDESGLVPWDDLAAELDQ
jgi:hypothetical protein